MLVNNISFFNGRIEVVLLLALMLPLGVFSQNHQKTNILFLMDASFSMRKEWDGGTKWKTAVNTLTEIVDNTSQIDNVNIGLRLFGHLYDEARNMTLRKLQQSPVMWRGWRRRGR